MIHSSLTCVLSQVLVRHTRARLWRYCATFCAMQERGGGGCGVKVASVHDQSMNCACAIQVFVVPAHNLQVTYAASAGPL